MSVRDPITTKMISTDSHAVILNLVATCVGGVIGASLRLLTLRSRLTGKWQGELACVSRFPKDLIRCELIMARPAGRQSVGFLFYARESVDNNEFSNRGLDELNHCERTNSVFHPKPQLKMVFIQRFQKRGSGYVDHNPARYTFTCSFDWHLSLTPKLYVETFVPCRN